MVCEMHNAQCTMHNIRVISVFFIVLFCFFRQKDIRTYFFSRHNGLAFAAQNLDTKDRFLLAMLVGF